MDINRTIQIGINKLAELELTDSKAVDSLWEVKIEAKPSTHPMKCPACKGQLSKGELTVRVVRGEIHTSTTYNRYHFSCFMALFYRQLIKVDWNGHTEGD